MQLYDQLPAEVRQIYSARKGQSSDPRSVLGLGKPTKYGETALSSLVSAEQIPVIMYKTLLAFLEADPLGMPKDQRSRMLSDCGYSEFEIEHVGKARASPASEPMPPDRKSTMKRLRIFLGSTFNLSLQTIHLGHLNRLSRKRRKSSNRFCSHIVFLTLGHMLFRRLIMTQHSDR